MEELFRELISEVRSLKISIDTLNQSINRLTEPTQPIVTLRPTQPIVTLRPTQPIVTQPIVTQQTQPILTKPILTQPTQPTQLPQTIITIKPEDKWLPIKLYGKIEDKPTAVAGAGIAPAGCFLYSFARNTSRFTYKDLASRAIALEQAQQCQIQESLRNTRNNRYKIYGSEIHLELRDDTFAICDLADLPRISEHVWYPHKNHVITRVGDKRIRMAEILNDGKDEGISYQNGNFLDNRRSNLVIKGIMDDNDQLFSEIPKQQWDLLKAQAKTNDLQMDLIVNHLDSLSQRYTKFPVVQYTPEELITDYRHVVNSDIQILSNMNWGAQVTLHFMRSTMFLARKAGFPTVDETWADPEKRQRLWRSMISLDMTNLTRASLLKAFGLKYYRVSNFPPLVARNLYDYYFLPEQSNKRVLDVCSGYGGRFMGFWASKTCSEYIGIDPNPHLVEPYHNLQSWMSTYFPNPNKRVTFIENCAEDVDYSQIGAFDIIFTSPPYFDLEIYAEDPKQSCHRYPQIESWRDNFLFKTLDKVILVLKPGGVLSINIKNSKKWKLDLCAEMCSFIQSKGLQQMETLSLPLSKRPNQGTVKEGQSFEPIFVFKKV